ncbi:Hypothetical protein FKW44_010742 [Caligus rogercresseyi]|uniref:Uncharacterized protein n=1 Tax=Caligus rogercresseyi TaxID=217165 RepID=A0A7T8K9S5_CALRO|nr:Hypothetical protein FKW44_010742 [Caligus rogercresseyi]
MESYPSSDFVRASIPRPSLESSRPPLCERIILSVSEVLGSSWRWMSPIWKKKYNRGRLVEENGYLA